MDSISVLFSTYILIVVLLQYCYIGIDVINLCDDPDYYNQIHTLEELEGY